MDRRAERLGPLGAERRRLDEDDTVAPVLLRSVEGGVGPLDDPVVGAPGASDADRDGNGDPGLERDRGGRDRLADPFAHDEGAVETAVGQDDDELLASPATDDVLDPGGAGDAAGDLPPDGVAGVVAGRVVDALEVVDVDDRHRQLVVVALGAGGVGGELLVEVPAGWGPPPPGGGGGLVGVGPSGPG